jgi:hypothetical protein
MACWEAGAPLNLQPRPGQQWAAVSGKNKEPGRAPRRRLRATYTRIAGVRHLLAAYELGEDKPPAAGRPSQGALLVPAVGGRNGMARHGPPSSCNQLVW